MTHKNSLDSQSYLRDERRTLRFAAVREVFEESNVLLCDPVLSPEVLTQWRPVVLKDWYGLQIFT
jgi:hypothetical protein